MEVLVSQLVAGGMVALGLVGVWVFLHACGGILAWVARRKDERSN
jgi:hypothetical protein